MDFLLIKEIDLLCQQDGSIISFNQTVPLYADKSFISNTFAASKYNAFSENIIGAGKLYLAAINGLKR